MSNKAVKNKISDVKPHEKKIKPHGSEVLDEFEPLFEKSETYLIKEFKKHNSIKNCLCDGEYYCVPNKGFGYFTNVSVDGKELTYPVSNHLVKSVFINSSHLKNGCKYLFEFTLAKGFERRKQFNPFLLAAKNDTVSEIEQIREIGIELDLKRAELTSVLTFLKDEQPEYIARREDFEKRLDAEMSQRQSEANLEVDKYNKFIEHKYEEFKVADSKYTILIDEAKEKSQIAIGEVEEKAKLKIKEYEDAVTKKADEFDSIERELVELHNVVATVHTNLNKMENLLSTLKDRVSLCRNLQFISEGDENKYLNLLSAKEFKPINHLDFEKDFEKNFSKLSEHIHAYLYHKKNLIYTRYQIKNFLTLLKTHDIIVLSGLSGSGKTQIIKAFAEALGGVAKIIPVKPNWTSSDDLIGYYNPLQMSFLPTPFTEAIVEAINNPNQLYFICLDEMNLARAEYYFADFLSKLEERSKQPEIELYANHEEELFVSEFSTLLNLIESSINGKKIKSWQEFLDNEEARKKFFEMLGNTDKESMLQLHAKMKRRLIDILKFPSTIRIPDNVRFIGAINVDETTHYFSPKILDRIHVVKFDNPLLFEEQVNNWFENTETEKELKPVYVPPSLFSQRKEFPTVNNSELSTITQKLKEINQKFLLPLNIDFGIRSIRQSLNYAELNKASYDYGDVFDISLNTVILQKIFPRFIFDGSETAKNGETKIKLVEELQKFLADEFNEFHYNYDSDETDIGKSSSEYLEEMIKQANRNNSQFNFFA